MILHDDISWHLRYNIFTQNSQHSRVLLPFMTIEYPLILEICLKLFQKYEIVILKKVWIIQIFWIYKRGKEVKREGESSAPNDSPTLHLGPCFETLFLLTFFKFSLQLHLWKIYNSFTKDSFQRNLQNLSHSYFSNNWRLLKLVVVR